MSPAPPVAVKREVVRRSYITDVVIEQRPWIEILADGTLIVRRDGLYRVKFYDPVNRQHYEMLLICEAGKGCDGASIGKWLRSFLSKWNATNAAVPHDWIYGDPAAFGLLVEICWRHIPGIIQQLDATWLTRKQGDVVFWHVLEYQEPVSAIERLVSYAVLRALGWAAWNKNKHGAWWRFRKATVKHR